LAVPLPVLLLRRQREHRRKHVGRDLAVRRGEALRAAERRVLALETGAIAVAEVLRLQLLQVPEVALDLGLDDGVVADAVEPRLDDRPPEPEVAAPLDVVVRSV